MNDPTVVSAGALSGRRVALSASESADLPRLGLSEFHCRLAIAEIGRALMIAGATVVYGGNLERTSYTDILINEAQRFAGRYGVLELVLPESEYGPRTDTELLETRARVGEIGKLVLVKSDGAVEEVREHLPIAREDIDVARALTAMRTFVSWNSDARVLVGGRLEGYQGAEPGVIEEARLSAEAGAILLVAGGYGGAAAAVAGALGAFREGDWAASDFPIGKESREVQFALGQLVERAPSHEWTRSEQAELHRTLTVSHRPADIAASVVQLLSTR